MALSIFLRDSIERRVSTSLVMETNEAGSGIIRKRPGDEIINWNYGEEEGGVGRNRTTLISSALFTISRQNGKLGCFDAHHAVTNYRVSQLERNYSLANGTILFPPLPFFSFFILLRYSMKLDALYSAPLLFPPLWNHHWIVVSLYILARTINFTKKKKKRND